MPLIQSTADALPYIDAAPSPEAMESANALIQAEVSAENQTSLHPSLPAFDAPAFSELITAEHARLATGGAKAGGIDLTRYEALDAPEKGNLEAWKATLAQAYASVEYLRGREINLGLLETYGKNAWLIANSQLEDILRSLEREVEASKLELEQVAQARRVAQENVAGEMQSLEETWRKGVGRMIETQAAVAGLKQEMLERKRAAAAVAS
ncbi:Pre-mRNA-splicing factor SPF27 [Neohortaea acidophila]|uniref:Pre-mRNA-splicing factor SPF27 n=1 Tax=Neohortaea acidophila TaxID=245834 RepID=A0A6A6PYZ9_9PEZI|nr:Pre-mRNA-splicing factor SPF27 [Neohortaea acidophila]KAF2485245.1 Pre-mRNA-splicing factor SPF27 [Neohortaea acidophila]